MNDDAQEDLGVKAAAAAAASASSDDNARGEGGKAQETQLYKLAAQSSVVFSGVARLDWEDTTGPTSRAITKSTIIGSSENADIIVKDATVSRIHAELEVRDDGVWLRDLQSSNGSWVQGVRVERALVPHLGRIRVGKTDLILSHVRRGAAQVEPVVEWPDPKFHGMLGGSRKMRALYATLARVAAADAPVLILGETGTGKEVVARSIHEESPRKGGPFVVVDCAALPENLLDAELFGHARGAFTGAVGARPGAIESASGGTVFLDEIGELPKSMQPKLLRVLEAKTVRRIGENDHRVVDVRFVFATHRDLLKMVSTGEFREDLYFRIGVLPVSIPPLRERLDDLEVLIAHFRGDRESTVLPPDLIAALHERTWTGNVRELRNFVDRMRTLGPERALAMTDVHAPAVTVKEGVAWSTPTSSTASSSSIQAAESARLGPEDFPTDIPTRGSFRSFRDRWNEHGERLYVNELLARHQRNVSAAAREAELDRTYLYKLIRKYGL
jgi:two-component system, NtrC family, response regulator GlrR